MTFTPRQLTKQEHDQLSQELADLNEMLPNPADDPHLREAVQNLLRRYGQAR